MTKGGSMINKRKENQDFDYIKPLKSACFDMEVRKAPASSSLKERIKLNQMLTISPKTGTKIGVPIKKLYSNVGLHESKPMTPSSQFMSPRNAQGQTNLKGNKTQALLGQYLVDRVVKQVGRRGRESM